MAYPKNNVSRIRNYVWLHKHTHGTAAAQGMPSHNRFLSAESGRRAHARACRPHTCSLELLRRCIIIDTNIVALQHHWAAVESNADLHVPVASQYCIHMYVKCTAVRTEASVPKKPSSSCSCESSRPLSAIVATYGGACSCAHAHAGLASRGHVFPPPYGPRWPRILGTSACTANAGDAAAPMHALQLQYSWALGPRVR